MLGPVVVLDDNGLRVGALSEISALVRAQLTRSLTTGSSAGLSFGCLTANGELGARVQSDIVSQLPSRFDRVPGLHWQELASEMCSDAAQEKYQNELRIEVRIEADQQQIAIDPQLSRQVLWIPLCRHRARRHVEMTARNIWCLPALGAISTNTPGKRALASDLL